MRYRGYSRKFSGSHGRHWTGAPTASTSYGACWIRPRGKLKPNGVIILEIDPHQVGPLEEQARRIFPNADVTVEQDLAHLDRIFIVDLGRESD